MTGTGEYEYEAFNEDGTPVEQQADQGEAASGGERLPMPKLPEEPVAVAPVSMATARTHADGEDNENDRTTFSPKERSKADKPSERAEAERSRTTGGKAGAVPHATSALRKRKLFVVALIVFGGFLGWTVMTNDKTKKDEGVPTRTPSVGSRQTLKPLDKEAPVLVTTNTPEKQEREDPKAVEEKDALMDAARRAPMMAFAGSKSGAALAATPASGNNTLDGSLDGLAMMQEAPADAGENEARRFDNRLKPTVLEGTKAGLLGNRNMIIAMGASIPCTLETAIATDQPGFTSCIISRDIMSDNGRVVLLDKGTQIVGEYRGGLQRGQKRLFVLWTRAKTPTGVIVQLASPATDALGRAGFDGYVDTHWWERFGSGLLLSMVGDLTTYGLNQIDSKDVSFENTSQSGKDAAAIAVEQSINIPPTLRKHQGELVSIFVARDLDFSGVYRLKSTGAYK